MRTNVSFLIVDSKVSLVEEELKAYNNKAKNTLFLATYSNSESAVLSYTPIFETIWAQTELKIKMEQKYEYRIFAHRCGLRMLDVRVLCYFMLFSRFTIQVDLITVVFYSFGRHLRCHIGFTNAPSLSSDFQVWH